VEDAAESGLSNGKGKNSADKEWSGGRNAAYVFVACLRDVAYRTRGELSPMSRPAWFYQ
jgi:hypothetical protein